MFNIHLERSLVFSTIYFGYLGSYVLIQDLKTEKLIERRELESDGNRFCLQANKCRFVPPNTLVITYKSQIRTVNTNNLEQKCIYITQQCKGNLKDICGLDFMDHEEIKIMLYSDKSGKVACQDLETKEIVYDGKFFELDSLDIISLENEKGKFCCSGINEVQIHDIEKKKLSVSGLTENKGYILGCNAGLCEIPELNLFGIGCHYGEYLHFLDSRSKNLKRVGRTEEFGMNGLEFMNNKVYSCGSAEEDFRDEGFISVHDIRKYKNPLSIIKGINNGKIDVVRKLDESKGIIGFSGYKKSFTMNVKNGKFFNAKMMRDLDYGQDINNRKNPKRRGIDSNVSLSRLRRDFLKLVKVDQDERTEYIKDNFLVKKEYRIRIVLKNSEFLCFRFLLFGKIFL